MIRLLLNSNLKSTYPLGHPTLRNGAKTFLSWKISAKFIQTNYLFSSHKSLQKMNKSILPGSILLGNRRNFATGAEEPFLSGSSANYIEDMYNAWQADPNSVHKSWDSFFRQAKKGSSPGSAHARPPNLAPDERNTIPLTSIQGLPSQSSAPSGSSEDTGLSENVENYLALRTLIRGYIKRGHAYANIDPLGISSGHLDINARMQNIHKLNRLTEKDFDNKLILPKTTFITNPGETTLTVREIQKRLDDAYCGSIGSEFLHITDPEQLAFLRERLERPNFYQFTKEDKSIILARLMRSTMFEMFLAKKWASEKRFGLEGCEMLIPAMKHIIDICSANGVESIVMGMAHRGRLNVLCNVCRKPLEHLFSQFAKLEATDEGAGDVKYHLGTYIERINTRTNKNIKLALVANSSHLEAQDPIVQGKTRAEQFYGKDKTGETAMSILLHGDAAFSGQGIVYETFHLSELPYYTTHGSIHIVVNNQIGFTTDPRYSRSSPYCTDVGRVVNAPIFHVNADDPEAVIKVAQIAAEFRTKFRKDVVIDLVGYRKNGHNEIDEPMFTQPLMYKKIKSMKPCLDKYAEKLIKEGAVTESELAAKKQEYEQICEEGFAKAQTITSIKYKEWLDSPWKGFFKGDPLAHPGSTGVDEETLKHIGERFSTPPGGDFVIHRGIERILKARMEMVENRMADWSLGEAFAIGSLLKDGIHVRLSGQDVERGTFSHRHHVLHHQTEDLAIYNSLNELYDNQAEYTVCNSSLSEYGVLGFELGYSMSCPKCLVIWEAQFGDFSNTAQCIIDQFLSAGQVKWVRQSGLVLLLPHGMEGMGPEHSSARLERFLQMSADDEDEIPDFNDQFVMKQLYDINWIVANCSTPANLFHILRRQLALPFRKPLIIMTPKSLLRLPDARSSFSEMTSGSEFQRIIPDSEVSEGSKKLIFCCGKAYYDLIKKRKELGNNKSVSFCRVEQLCPFPYDLIMEEVKKHPDARLVWFQEEHKNQGAWSYVQPRFQSLFPGKDIHYNGRPVSASPATGNKVQNLKEIDNMLQDAFTIGE